MPDSLIYKSRLQGRVRCTFQGFTWVHRLEGVQYKVPFQLDKQGDMNITLDFMMIIGKYFKTNADYINVMKVNKKYINLTKMYKYNPISDTRLFKNIETQHFYSLDDVFYKHRFLYHYVYWIDWYFINLTGKDSLYFFPTNKCCFKFGYVNKIMKYLYDTGYITDQAKYKRLAFDLNDYKGMSTIFYNQLKQLGKGLVVFKYADEYFGFKLEKQNNSFDEIKLLMFFVNDKTFHNLSINSNISRKKSIFLIDNNVEIFLYIYLKSDTDSSIEMNIDNRDLNDRLPNKLFVTDWLVIEEVD